MRRKGGTSQEFPPLDFNNIRKREFMQYNDEERASVVYHWLVDGMTTREMDAKILGFLPDGSSHGYQSFGIYRYLGLTGKHQGFFRGWETGDIVAYLHAKSLDDDILVIFRYIADYISNHGGIDMLQSDEIADDSSYAVEVENRIWVNRVWMPQRGKDESIDEHLLNLPDVDSSGRGRVVSGKKEIFYSSGAIKETVKDLYDFRCQICGDVVLRRGWKMDLDRMASWKYLSADVHHVLPLSKGGPDSRDNMLCLCPSCHRKFHSGEFRLKEKGNGLMLSDELLGKKEMITLKHQILLY